MEGKEIYVNSYEEVSKLLKHNCTNEISIDYTKFDCETKGVLKQAIHSALMKRKKEIGDVIFKCE